MPQIPFADLPPERRMAIRAAVEAAGGMVATYIGPYVQVAVPDPPEPFYDAMEAAGLEPVRRSAHFFPLGTDAPPAHLRHDGRFPGSKGFWLYANFAPASEDKTGGDLFRTEGGGDER
jgi:hypothetical protein